MSQRQLNVLIIDDHMDEHVLYEEYLTEDSNCRYQFFNAYTGTEGEKLYNKHKVDCVLLDYNLPDINGIEVLKRLSEKGDIVPAIMLTGEGNESVAVIAMKTGMQDYIPKRVITSQALCRTVTRAVERSEMMSQVENYRRELERSNQDLERFATVAAHDLKAPLRAITQHLELVRKHLQDHLDERSLTSIRFACEGASRMRDLIEALFEFSRVGFEKQVPARINTQAALQSAEANLSVNLEEKAARVTHGTLPVITADATQFVQLLQNLIANAIKYCERTPEIYIDAKRENNIWIFSVKDNGIGIPAACLSQIFTIFKRLHTPQEYPGSGMGLAICERIVRNHGGNIWVESTPGKGSVFYFTFPIHDENAQEKAA